MENALKGLLIAAGIILTCTIVGIGFYVAREANATAAVSADKISEVRKNITDSSLMKYDGIKVTGSDVINLAKKLLRKYDSMEAAPVTVSVKTSKVDEVYQNKQYLNELTDFTKNRYINPSGIFLGEVQWDENDVLISIRFVEQ
ncbi:MAG: hypothetical protein E7256_13165 [Lachnospiraceae bacterium]|nr:hypothetical protein [Lachnospiraceae bacterium]